MTSFTVDHILKLNTAFYQSTAKEFSKTRKYPWKGWGRVGDFLKKWPKDKKLNILDVGCGNGRFLCFLNANVRTPFSYLGFDNNDSFLKECKINFKDSGSCKFKKLDVFKNLQKTKGSYDMVVVFGLTHHLPSGEFLDGWLKQVSDLVCTNGYLFLSFWYPKNTKPGVYLFGWDSRPNNTRYVHVFSLGELKHISEILQYRFELCDNYTDGIQKDDHNIYLVFRKG